MTNLLSKEFALLSEVSELLDNYKLKQVDVLGNEDSTSRYTEFWRLIKTGEINNDKDAAQHFYQTDENNPNYKKFRLEFRDRLINMVWHIDALHPNYRELDSAHIACHEQLALINVLSSNSCIKSVHLLLKELLEQSLKYEFVDISFAAATRLRRIAANNTEDDKDFEKHSQLCEKLEEEYYNEIKVVNYYDHLLSFYIRKRALQKEAFTLGEKYLRELKPHFHKNASPKFIITYSSIAAVKCISIGDYKGLDEAAMVAIDFLTQKPFDAGRSIAIFHNQRILANRQLKKYETALDCIEKSLAIQLKGTNNWFSTKELSVTLNLHKKDYQQAWEIFTETKAQKGFKHLTNIRKEDWLVIEAYLAILIKLNKIKGDTGDFKIKKVLNLLEISAKDKVGRNVSLLILKVVHDIINKQEENLIQEIEILSKYRSRYVKGDSEARAYLFIKLLGVYAQSGGNKKMAFSSSKATYQTLLEEEYDINDQNHVLEVIPFEHLWPLAMEQN